MREIEQSSRFKRDLKREAKGRHRQALQTSFVSLLADLADDKPLPQRLMDHDLTGNWNGYRECHVLPDLLLIYRKYNAETGGKLYLARLGSHGKLF